MYLLLIFLLTIVIPFIVIPKRISAGKKLPYEVVGVSVLTICISAVVVFMVASMAGKGVFSQLHETIAEVSKMAANDPVMVKALKMEALSESERVSMLIKAYDMVLKLIPSFILIVGTLVSYFSYVVLSKSMAKRAEVKLMPKFREFAFPGGAVMALIIMYMISWMMMISGDSSDSSFYMNMDMIFDFMFFIQGMSVIFMLFYVKHIPKALGVILSLVMWNIILGRTMFIMIGMFDLIMGFKIRLLLNSRRK